MATWRYRGKQGQFVSKETYNRSRAHGGKAKRERVSDEEKHEREAVKVIRSWRDFDDYGDYDGEYEEFHGRADYRGEE